MSSVLTLITILLYVPYYVQANTIIADQPTHGETINCASNQDCTVICNNTDSCYSADINCPLNYACNIQCTAHQACKTAKFNCGYSTACHILCQSDVDQAYTCQDARFTWPINNNNYSLTCSGGRSCYGLTISAPDDNQEFNFNCTGGEGTCFQSTINCPTSADCNIKCIGPYGCHSVTLKCPTSADSQCNIDCIGLESCQNMKVTGNGIISTCTGEKSCHSATFPQPPPNEIVNINCLDEASCENANIKCPTQADCIITCTGQNSCQGVSITFPNGTNYTTQIICDLEATCNGLPDPPTGSKSILTTSIPTPKPTTSTTDSPSYGVTLSLTFNYSTNGTIEDIDSIIEVIIENILTDSIINQSIYECGTYTINVNVAQNNDIGSAQINATVPLCNKEDVNKLISYFRSELSTDIIDEFENDPEIKLIAIQNVIIKEKEIIVITTTEINMETSVVNKPVNNDKDNGNMVVILMVVIICLLICILLLLYYLYKKQLFFFSNDRNKSGDVVRITSVEQEIQMNTKTKQIGENGTKGIVMEDEDEGLYTNGNEVNNIDTPSGPNDNQLNDTPMGGNDTPNGNDNYNEEKTDEDDDMYVDSGNENENETPQYVGTPGQRQRDNTVPDLPPIDD